MRSDDTHRSGLSAPGAEHSDDSYSLPGLIRQFQTGISREQLARLAEQTPVNATTSVTLVVLILVFVSGQTTAPLIFAWAAVQFGLILFVFLRWRRSLTASTHSATSRKSLTRSGLRHAVMWATLSGGTWGSLTAFLPGAPPHVQLALILTMGGMAAGASATLAAVPQVAIAFILGCGIPVTVYHLALGDQADLLLAMVFAIFTTAMIGTSHIVSTALMRQFRAEERADELRESDTLRAIAEKANAALQESDARLRDAIESISEGFILYDADERFVLCNSQYRDLYPPIANQLQPGAKLEDMIRIVFEADAIVGTAKDVDGSTKKCLANYRTASGIPHEDHLKDGRWVLSSERLTSSGGIVGIRTDITEQRRTGEHLKQAQKMEAVGQLTGGVAHDFNNLLAVIRGNAELLADDTSINPALTAPIIRAVTRGAELTQRLLAFSRQQPLRPQVIELCEMVAGMSDMLTRTLGETIELQINVAAGVWNVLADAGQVENAVLNLALNARDAMPEGGKLIIECANTHLAEACLIDNPDAAPGDYVALAVSDDGTGMTEEVRARAFEPFFTTKEVGEGSGLGLSMVYGFAKQSDGHISIYSEIGKGTTVKLYLPRAVAAKQKTSPTLKRRVVPRGQGEVILVIEDDPDVRALAVLMLENLEYRVIAVGDAAGAHKVMTGETPIDLILSDVVLPGGTSGPQFAERARGIYPGIKIIFMSGYPAEAAMRNGFLGTGEALLNKPFERAQLATTIRQILDR